ncbi:MAG: phosphate signaling complex protein PhoU [Anaerolineae bacterium]|jgi:phosphate transport system protein
MPRESFDRELQALQDKTLAMASMVENALKDSIEYLKRRDLEGSERLIAQDCKINERRFEIEREAMMLIATQQPMAIDMRTIAAVLEITTELERIGDYAKGIAKIILMIGDEPLVKPLIDLPLMARKARGMLHEALDAFVRRDVELARALPARDDEIDGLYSQVYRELITYIIADPSTIEQANYLLWAAHNVERTADRVINICERIVFTVTGEMEEMDTDECRCLAVESLG